MRFAVGSLLGVGLLPLSAVTAAEKPTLQQLAKFDADPGWDGFRNRLVPDRPREVRQEFGYRSSHFAHGASKVLL